MFVVEEKKRRVLIVDDNELNIEILANILKSSYKISVATSGERAIEIANSKMQPDLILLDIVMPEMDGYEVCTRLKNSSESADIPIIFVTAKDKDEDEEKGFELGAVDYITKPFKESSIKARVKTHIKLKEQEDMLVSFNKSLMEQTEIEVAQRMKSEKFYRIVFENSPEGIIIVDRDFKISKCNKMAASILNFNKDELIGLGFFEISSKKQLENRASQEIGLEIFDEVAGGESKSLEWAHIDRDGEEIAVLATFARLDRESRETIIMWKDMTEIKKLQTQKEIQETLLAQQSKLAEMGEMIAVIAHQWKQPISSIYLMTQLIDEIIEDDDIDRESISEYCGTIMDQTEFMTNTINDFKNFLSPNKNFVNFEPCISIYATLKILDHQLKMENIKVIIHEHEHVNIFGVENEFKQVMLNLFKNSRDAFFDNKKKLVDRDKKIEVFIVNIDDFVEIEVKDNAGGIPEHLLPNKIFEAYITTKGDNGTGIGLQISKRIIVENFKGEMIARNRDDGASFLLKIPRSKRK